jgi:hypothetical protein
VTECGPRLDCTGLKEIAERLGRPVARILEFPERGPFSVRVEREDTAWLVICRDHGWLHGSHHEAIAVASTIARGFGVGVEVVNP